MYRGFTWWLCALLVAAIPAAVQRSSRTFTELSGGIILEEPEFTLRSMHGGTGGIALGREWNDWLTVSARLSASRFNAPPQFVSPAGCTTPPLCVLPLSSNVEAVTLGANGEYHGPRAPLMAVVLFGVGGRYVREAPQRSSDVRPYAELGVGLVHDHWGVRARYQVAGTGRDLPGWMVPVTLDYRF